MLYTIAVVLLIRWLLGLVSGYTLATFVHLLLVIAIGLFLAALVRGRRIVGPRTASLLRISAAR